MSKIRYCIAAVTMSADSEPAVQYVAFYNGDDVRYYTNNWDNPNVRWYNEEIDAILAMKQCNECVLCRNFAEDEVESDGTDVTLTEQETDVVISALNIAIALWSQRAIKNDLKNDPRYAMMTDKLRADSSLLYGVKKRLKKAKA